MLLEKRAKVYPIRDQNTLVLINTIRQFIDYLIKSNKSVEFKPDKSIIESLDKLLRNPLFICGNMKSGTSLILQLLDGHKDLLVIPGDSHYFNKFFKSELDINEFCYHWINKIINPTGQKPFWILGKEEKILRVYLYYLQYFFVKFNDEPFFAFISSLYAINPERSRSIKYWVEKTPGNEFHTKDLLRKYPNAKFIHIIRDPLPNIASLKRSFKYRNRPFNSWIIALYLKRTFRILLDNIKKVKKNNYYVLKYEDLVSDPYSNMIEICKFLGIDFEEVLCVPSENKKPATANSMYEDSRVLGVVNDQSKNYRWIKELNEGQKKDVVSILYDLTIKLGYDEWKKEYIKKYNKFFHLIKINIVNRPINKLRYTFSK